MEDYVHIKIYRNNSVTHQVTPFNVVVCFVLSLKHIVFLRRTDGRSDWRTDVRTDTKSENNDHLFDHRGLVGQLDMVTPYFRILVVSQKGKELIYAMHKKVLIAKQLKILLSFYRTNKWFKIESYILLTQWKTSTKSCNLIILIQVIENFDSLLCLIILK